RAHSLRESSAITLASQPKCRSLRFGTAVARVLSANGAWGNGRMTGRLPRIQNPPKEDLPDSERTEAPASHETRRRRVMLIVGSIVALVAVGIGARYYLWALHHESTDDAFIDGHIVHVAPQVGGRVSQ